MIDDVHNLRPLCDVLVVALHKGIIHTPIKLARYERDISRAAIDAGADLILGHHAHILKGIEFYKGKAIFHGLNNLIAVLRSLTPKPNQDRQAWARKRRELYNFEPDPEYPAYPFHPEARQTMIAKFIIEGGKIYRLSYLPCLVNKKSQPELLKNDERGQEVFKYMDKITQGAGLNARYKWEGDEVVIYAD
jgi:poly-gamma-glutamate synthesis protein (capsule biosynthesis protein)